MAFVLPKPKKTGNIKDKLASNIRADVREQRKELITHEEQFTNPIVRVNIETGKVEVWRYTGGIWRYTGGIWRYTGGNFIDGYQVG